MATESSLLILSNSTDMSRIIMFDLDYTLIKTKSGYKFPRHANDFEFMPGVLDKLVALNADGYHIIIISNQGSRNRKLSESKVRNVYSFLSASLKLSMYVAFGHDNYRKPNIGIWTEYIWPSLTLYLDSSKENMKILWVADALGRAGDFSDSDLQFANNVNHFVNSLPTLNTSIKSEVSNVKKEDILVVTEPELFFLSF